MGNIENESKWKDWSLLPPTEDQLKLAQKLKITVTDKIDRRQLSILINRAMYGPAWVEEVYCKECSSKHQIHHDYAMFTILQKREWDERARKMGSEK